LGAEGVISLHQELEYQHAKSESIMLGLSHYAANGPVVKLGRRILQLANRTGVKNDVISTRLRHLKRICIDDGDQSGRGDQHIAFVQVADDIATGVQGSERSG
jgi:hypothetical protein